MDRVTVLTRSSHIDHPDIPISTVQSVLAPAFANVIHIQRLLSSVSVSLLLHAWVAARLTMWAGRLCVVQAWLATSLGLNLSGRAAAGAWSSHYMKAIRKRAERDFACFILGSGNGIFLMLFWPGWWILGGTALAVSQFFG
jgi:hypothetical protein